MRADPATPGIVPEHPGTVHIVLDDCGDSGRIYRETEEDQQSLDIVIHDMMTGQYKHPVRVIAFNVSGGWSRDVSQDVARLIVSSVAKFSTMPRTTRVFVEAQLGEKALLRRH